MLVASSKLFHFNSLCLTFNYSNLTGSPRWTPVEEYGSHAKHFQGVLRREQFLEIGVGAI